MIDLNQLKNSSEKKLYTDMLEEYWKCTDILFRKFFDLDSTKMLKEKIEVLKAINSGTVPAEIPNYYKVLEKYPEQKKGETVNWD